ncbi:6701_t:CDS:2 [Acaulospora colombiana]|uniref:6701_t:CDS:1 n=1 Tax=Acaulospora colombiana TaxID=27376 RepID=A0ACA9KGU0_9GLOM|nr:6701_t:CDS:2 [Acaulospora colombiana]
MRYFKVLGNDSLSIIVWPPRRGLIDSVVITPKHAALQKLTEAEDVNSIAIHDVSSEVFKVLIDYMYCASIKLNDKMASEIFEILLGAEKLKIEMVIDGLQCYLVEHCEEYLSRNFSLIYRASFERGSLRCLQEYCTRVISDSPEVIFSASDFTSIPMDLLTEIVGRDDLQMDEVDVWNSVLKWGLAQSPILTNNPESWSLDEIKFLNTALQDLFELIRFVQLSSRQFKTKVIPYKNILPSNIYEELMGYFIPPRVRPTSIIILAPRRGLIDSKIITTKHAIFITSWIDQKDKKEIFFQPYDDNPYVFELLFRGSRDGFSPSVFHEICDNKAHTVWYLLFLESILKVINMSHVFFYAIKSVMRVTGTNEILGGYNPVVWQRLNCKWGESTNSFIFSFPSNDFVDTILSRVSIRKKAINLESSYGPSWGYDLMMVGPNLKKRCSCNQDHLRMMYEKPIREKKGEFEIDDYEVFLIERKDGKPLSQ